MDTDTMTDAEKAFRQSIQDRPAMRADIEKLADALAATKELDYPENDLFIKLCMQGWIPPTAARGVKMHLDDNAIALKAIRAFLGVILDVAAIDSVKHPKIYTDVLDTRSAIAHMLRNPT